MDFFCKNTGFFYKICYTESRNRQCEEVGFPMGYRRAYVDLRVGGTTADKPLMLDEILFCPALFWLGSALLSHGVERLFVVCDELWRDAVEAALSGLERTAVLCGEAGVEDDALVIDQPLLPVTVEGSGAPFGWLPIASRGELSRAAALCRDAVCARHECGGVTFIDPATTYIDPRAAIGAGTVVLPNTIVRGACSIGAGCELGPNTMIRDCRVGDHTTVNASQINESTIGSHTTVGPFAYVRPGCTVGDHCRIGDFVELKNSVLDDGTKVSHLTYVGDSDVGKRVNFGCGTVTTNYDGKKKYRCTVGDDVFLGCNTNLVAPVTVGDGAYTAAGSTITEDVPAGALAVARARQENKGGWVKKFFARK